MKLTLKKLKKMIEESLSKRQAMATAMNTRGLPMGTYSADHYGENPLSQYIERGRPIKQIFSEYADQEFLRSLITIHYRDAGDMSEFATEITPRDELSCVAWRAGETFSFGHPLGSSSVGIVVQGRVTLLTNDTAMMVSGMGGAYRHHFPERTRQSGTNKGAAVVPSIYDIVSRNSAYVLSEEDWQPREEGGIRKNEALVQNWRILAYVVNDIQVAKYIQQLVEEGLIEDTSIISANQFTDFLRTFQR